jgi:hypothetical protein
MMKKLTWHSLTALLCALCTTTATRAAEPNRAGQELPDTVTFSEHIAPIILKHAQIELKVARKGLAEAEKVAPGMIGDSAEIWVWSRRVLQSELTLSTTKSERIAALEAHLRRAVKLEKIAENEYRQGRLRALDLLEVVYRRHDVEARLAEEKAKSASLYQ